MELIKQSHEIIKISESPLQDIETAARTCYKSEGKICDGSAEKLVRNLAKRKHSAMIEFSDMTVRFITNRGVTHELVRHRLCSFAQESTRYVNYKNGVQFIEPVWPMTAAARQDFLAACAKAETDYINMVESHGWKPQQAREVLPNSVKTEIVVKANLREWRHIIALRTGPDAHPQMSALVRGLAEEMEVRVPELFSGLASKKELPIPEFGIKVKARSSSEEEFLEVESLGWLNHAGHLMCKVSESHMATPYSEWFVV